MLPDITMMHHPELDYYARPYMPKPNSTDSNPGPNRPLKTNLLVEWVATRMAHAKPIQSRKHFAWVIG